MYAQAQPIYTILDAKSGLISNTVYDMKVVSNGMLYIAHSKGLSSFDGTRFINYYNKSFPFQSVSNILQTENGSIWCRSFDGSLFELICDTLVCENKVPAVNYYCYASTFHNNIIGMISDSVFIFDAEKRILQKKEIPVNISDEIPSDILFASTTRYYKKEQTLFCIVVDTHFNVYRQPINKNYSWHPIFNIYGNKPVRINTGFNKLLFAKFPVLSTIQQLNSYKNTVVNNIVLDDSLLWVCTTSGVYKIRYEHAGIKPVHLLKEYNISYTCKDREGNYYYSTIGNGIITIPSHDLESMPNTDQSNNAFAKYKNHLYIGSRSGEIFSYDITNNTVRKIYTPDKKKSVEYIYYDTINQALVASSNQFMLIKDNTAIKDRFIVKDIDYLDSNVLMVTNAGLFFIKSSNDKRIENTLSLKKKVSEVKNLYTTSLYQDDKVYAVSADKNTGQLAVLSFKGLSILDYKNGTIKRVATPSNVVCDILWHQGRLYVATKDKGLFVYHNNTCRPVTDTAGYTVDDFILKLYCYNDELWIHTEKGIYLYLHNKLSVYNNSVGLPIDQVREIIVSSDKIYANTGTDIISFSKTGSMKNTVLPAIIVNSITNASGEKSVKRPFEISFRENSINIDFSLIAFGNAVNTHLAYSINDNHIVHLPNQARNINLDNLAPDNYTVTLIPVVYNKLIYEQSQKIIFSVNPPFWKTVWFMVLLVLFFSLLVWQIMQVVIRNQRKEFALKKARLQLESQLDKSILSSIKSQMNPHFIFNALNTIQSYIYMNDKNSASIYISKFSDLTRSVLEMSTKDTISIDEEINSLNLYLELEKMRFEDSFHYQVNVDKQLNKELIRMPSMLVQPYVENAIKHGLLHKKNNRELNIFFQKENSLLRIIIDDNGIGRKRSAELNSFRHLKHNSFAMNANKKRIEILQNTFKDIQLEIIDKHTEMGEAKGTRVIISFPL